MTEKTENGKVSYKSLLGYVLGALGTVLLLISLSAGFIRFAFFTNAEGRELKEKVVAVEKRQDNLESQFKTINTKLDTLIMRSNGLYNER